MKIIICVLLLSIANSFCFAQDVNQPKPPTAPVKPIVPGAKEITGYPKLPPLPPAAPLPSFPAMPDNRQTNEQVKEIDRYELTVSGAFPGGDTRRNVADSISGALYILYSNGNISLKLQFKNAPDYVYHLRNPRARMEMGPGISRQMYDVTVQVGREFLLEQYTGELYTTEAGIVSASIFANSKIVVTLNFTKKQ